MKSLPQVVLVALLLAKIILGSLLLYSLDSDSLLLEGDAIASEEEVQKVPEEPVPEEKPAIVEENIDVNFLLNKRAELNRQEERLEKKRAELLAIQDELNKKNASLTELRNEIRTRVERKQAVEGQKIKKLIKAYSAMKPQKAASLVERLEMGFAIELLSQMKGEAVGNILSFVDTEKGARLSEALGKRR